MSRMPKRILKSLLRIGAAIAVFLLFVWIALAQPTLWNSHSEPAVTIDPTRLETHVRMLSETLLPRDSSNIENLDKAAAYIASHFEEAQAAVSEQYYEIRDRGYRNVIAHFGPDSGERIIVGAHYDDAFEFPGADDNASGVAGLIELAFLLKDQDLPIPVYLIAFTLEESPYFSGPNMGSAVHARSLLDRNIRVRLMVSLEMIGFYTESKRSQNYPMPILKLLYPSRGNFIAIIGQLGEWSLVSTFKKAMQAASPLPVHSINAPSYVPGIDFSDHRNYWEAGYPAIMVSDTSFFRNENYHTANDKSDTLDYERMAMPVKSVYNAILAIARLGDS